MNAMATHAVTTSAMVRVFRLPAFADLAKKELEHRSVTL